MPQAFGFPDRTEIWLAAGWNGLSRNRREGHWLSTIARLKPGELVEKAQAELSTVQNRIAADNPRDFIAQSSDNERASLRRRRPAAVSDLVARSFGLVTLVLVSAGIYSVVSYSVSRRTHEFGIRMALGARTRDVLSLVLWNGMKLAVVGIGLGLMGSFVLMRVLKRLLFGVSATDPIAFALAALVLAAVVLLASSFPARRATRVDPVTALRYE